MTTESSPTPATLSDSPESRPERALSRLAVTLAILLLAATYFLISPLSDATYPGHKPWRPGSILQKLTSAMSLGNAYETVRGVEIKSLALYGAASISLLLLAASFLGRRREVHFARHLRQPWFHAQILLVFWVVLSFSSAFWSIVSEIAVGQSTIYALQLAVAIALGWLIRAPDFRKLVYACIVIPAVGAALCIWYYHERNSLHRPGFPIGNPSTLAACTAPALLIALTLCVRWVRSGLQSKSWQLNAEIILSVVALVPLLWCIRLTWSRAALVSIAVGVAFLVFLQMKRRVRWFFLGGCIAAVVGFLLWYTLVSSQDASNFRGATLRYRFYTWRYAAELWQRRPGSGIGAGAYPQFAGERAATDRALDSGAFLGETITHAHNELFEIFAEIGLIGGVTWVGGMLATLVAGLRVLRARPPTSNEHWHVLAFVVAFVVLLTDSMFGVSFRLPGAPAFFALVLAAIWAHAKASAAARPDSILDVLDSRTQPLTYRTATIGVGCLLASAAAGWATVQYANATIAETNARVALRDRDYRAAVNHAKNIMPHILDPVHYLQAHDTLMRAHSATAAARLRETAEDLQTVDSAEKAASIREEAKAAAGSAFAAARDLLVIAPGWHRVGAYAAAAAETRAEIDRQVGDPEAADWLRRAHEAWLLQSKWLPYDFETLLALQRYPAPTAEKLRWLRDALRSEEFDRNRWREALSKLRAAPGFAASLAALERSIGPLNPQTDRDLLIARFAPESHRLLANIAFFGGDFGTAAAAASKAEKLYEPLRSRFPLMRSRTLAEQAEYLYRADPSNARRAADLIAEAIRLLPDVQAELYESFAQPYRDLRIGFLLAARAPVAEIEAIINQTLRDSPANASAFRWRAILAIQAGDIKKVEQVLAEAEESGVEEKALQQLRAEIDSYRATPDTD